MTLSEKRRIAGRKGGLTTLARHGIGHYKELGKYLPHTRYPNLAEILHRDSSNRTKGGMLTGRALSLAAQSTIERILAKYEAPACDGSQGG